GNVLLGDFIKANDAYTELLEIFDPSIPFSWELASSGYLEIGAKAWQMVCLQFLGETKRARVLASDHLHYADEHHDSMTLYHIHTFPALYCLEARAWQQAYVIIENYIPIVKEFGDPVFILTAEVYYHIASAFIGNASSLDIAVNLLETCFKIGFKAFGVSLSPYISDLYLHYKKPELALQWSNSILEHVNRTGTHSKTCELLRLKGLALIDTNADADKAEEAFNQAISLAQKQSAKTFELRASKDLAELFYKAGNIEKAKKLLKPIYNWFEPDEDSIDLAEAEKLLVKLSGDEIN
ncbi:MAG: hypothetical protein HKN68_22855, partial [Saprospiraceae bacterium]|nr:hypothetical protein [Saprospiraceae bacterium]